MVQETRPGSSQGPGPAPVPPPCPLPLQDQLPICASDHRGEAMAAHPSAPLNTHPVLTHSPGSLSCLLIQSLGPAWRWPPPSSRKLLLSGHPGGPQGGGTGPTLRLPSSGAETQVATKNRCTHCVPPPPLLQGAPPPALPDKVDGTSRGCDRPLAPETPSCQPGPVNSNGNAPQRRTCPHANRDTAVTSSRAQVPLRVPQTALPVSYHRSHVGRPQASPQPAELHCVTTWLPLCRGWHSGSRLPCQARVRRCGPSYPSTQSPAQAALEASSSES